MRYKVIRTCYAFNRYFKKGEIVELGAEVVPEHFAPLLSAAEKIAAARSQYEPAEDKEVVAENKDVVEETKQTENTVPLEEMTIGSLQKLAKEYGLDMPRTAKKAELIAAIRGE